MLGKKSVLDSLAMRRQELVAESDYNRTEFSRELEALKQEVSRVTSPVKKAGHYISAGAKAVGALLALRKVWSQTHDGNGKRNWTATLLHAARIGISLWPAFRSRAR